MKSRQVTARMQTQQASVYIGWNLSGKSMGIGVLGELPVV
jgi:hypothetical protein